MLTEPAAEAAPTAETERDPAYADLARRYGRLARVAYGAGFLALALMFVLWAGGAVASSDPLFRGLLVAGVVFLVAGALAAKLAELAFSRRRSTPRREAEGRPS